MKKTVAALLALCLSLVCALALGEIAVTKKDMQINRNLDKNVTNILVIMQDGERTDAMMIASVNSRTGRSVMTSLDCGMTVTVPEAGEVTLGEVYALGAPKSRGLLAARTVNALLELNISTYVALDVATLPSLVEEIGTLDTWLIEEEAAILNMEPGDASLTGEQVLQYVRIHLDSDSPEENRSYTVFMDLLRQGMHSKSGTNLIGLGTSLLSAMDSNMNVMSAVTLFTAFQGGSDRREMRLSGEMTPEEMRGIFCWEVYEQ